MTKRSQPGTDIVKRLRLLRLDKDNFPRMDCETYLPVGLALEAADEIERLQVELEKVQEAWYGRCVLIEERDAEIERLRKQIKDLDAMHDEEMVRHD